MSGAVTYLLDANVFIEAKRRYYAFDICPGFWDALQVHHSKGLLASVDRVKKELEQGKDELSKWAKSTIAAKFFIDTSDGDVVHWYSQIVAWVSGRQQFLPEAKANFVAGADGWLIAYAKVKQLTVVTHEVLAPEVRKKVPIPNVCSVFDVLYIDTFEMLRALNTRFALDKKK